MNTPGAHFPTWEPSRVLVSEQRGQLFTTPLASAVASPCLRSQSASVVTFVGPDLTWDRSASRSGISGGIVVSGGSTTGWLRRSLGGDTRVAQGGCNVIIICFWRLWPAVSTCDEFAFSFKMEAPQADLP